MVSNNKDDEDPFDLIQKGNAFASSYYHWSAADAYSRASLALRNRANALSDLCKSQKTNTDEKQKVISLYTTQSLEYFHKARHSLLEALVSENAKDKRKSTKVTRAGKGNLDPICSVVSGEEVERRKRIFNILFGSQNGDTNKSKSVGVEAAMAAAVVIDHEEIPAAPSSLLPTTTSSVSNIIEKNDSQQRLNEIRSGLQRMGVSLPDEQNELIIKPEMSSDDLVRLVMQQASEEVLLEGNSDHLVKSIMQQTSYEIPLEESSKKQELHYNDSLIDENDSMFEGFQDEPDDDLEALMIKVDKMIESAKASSSSEKNDASDKQNDHLLDNQLRMIEHAQALLLQARLCLALERGDEDGDVSSDVRHFSRYESGIISMEGQGVKLDRRRQARDRIESAVCSLQDGLAKWT